MKSLILFCGVLIISLPATAQQPVQFFSIREQVKPSMNSQYVNWLKTLRETYQKNQVSLQYNTFIQDDNTYYFFIPMQPFDLTGIYKNASDISEKVGRDAIEKLFSEKGKYIESRQEFITALIPEYTYLAPAQGDNFRQMMFWFPLDGMEAEVEKIAKEWVQLHQLKKAPNGYQTFKTVFGDEPGYVIVTWGKDPVDRHTKAQKNNELFADSGVQLWARTMAITKKIYFKTAWFRPDLSYKGPVTASE